MVPKPWAVSYWVTLSHLFCWLLTFTWWYLNEYLLQEWWNVLETFSRSVLVLCFVQLESATQSKELLFFWSVRKISNYLASSKSSIDESCAVIGYRSGLYGDILPAFWRKKMALFMPYNKSFIGQACSQKTTVNTPRCIVPSRPINTQKVGGQYPAILTSCSVNNPCVLPYLSPPRLTCVAIPPRFLSIWSANIADAAFSSMLLFVP